MINPEGEDISLLLADYCSYRYPDGMENSSDDIQRKKDSFNIHIITSVTAIICN